MMQTCCSSEELNTEELSPCERLPGLGSIRIWFLRCPGKEPHGKYLTSEDLSASGPSSTVTSTIPLCFQDLESEPKESDYTDNSGHQ